MRRRTPAAISIARLGLASAIAVVMSLTGLVQPVHAATVEVDDHIVEGTPRFETDGEATPASPQWAAIPQPNKIDLSGETAWKPAEGSRIFLLREQQDLLQREADRLSSEVAAITGGNPIAIVVGDETQIEHGDLVLSIADVPLSDHPEAYEIEIGDTVAVAGETTEAVFRATRQILHNLTARGELPAGRVAGSPSVDERALHADLARKFYSAEWIEQELRDLAYVGINTFQWHFSENEGFRIESEDYPQVVSAEHISKEQVRELLALAADLHIDVVPSLAMPGHMQQILNSYPELQLRDASGEPVLGALDITQPEAMDLVGGLIDEYADLFPDATRWNVAADEFVDFENMSNYPALQEEALAKFGPDANGFDLLTDFANQIADYVEDKGYTARVWNDGMWRSNTVDLDQEIQINWWTNWSPDMATLRTALDAGHSVMNYNDSLFYYVLGGGYQYPTAQQIWERDWHPGLFPTYERDDSVHQQVIEQPYTAQLLGASFAIWSDRPTAQTQDQVSAGIRSPLRAMAERSWNGGSALNLSDFTSTATDITRAPGINAPLGAPGETTLLPVQSEPTDEPTDLPTDEPTDGPSEPVEQVVPIPDEDLTAAARGGVTAPAIAGRGEKITVGVPTSVQGQTVRIWLHSVPAVMVTEVVGADGTITAVVPNDAELGDHRVVVQAHDGSLIGWAPLKVVTESVQGTGGEEVLEASDAADSLALTGFSLGSSVLIALGALLAGVGALTIRRRHARRGAAIK